MLSGVNLPDIREDTQNAIRAAISGAAVGALGSNISAQSVIARSTGQILNSNLELLFQGVILQQLQIFGIYKLLTIMKMEKFLKLKIASIHFT